MLEEIARLFLCFAAGDVLARIGVLPCPGSVCGLVLLYLDLLVLGRVPAALGTLADSVLGFLGMLFVPASWPTSTFSERRRSRSRPPSWVERS